MLNDVLAKVYDISSPSNHFVTLAFFVLKNNDLKK